MNKLSQDEAALKRLAGASKECKLYYLNDYNTLPTLRIEMIPGGWRCLWKARTSMKKMQETKRFLEKCWNRK